MSNYEYNFDGLEPFFQELEAHIKSVDSHELAYNYEIMSEWTYANKESHDFLFPKEIKIRFQLSESNIDKRMLFFLGEIFCSRKKMSIQDMYFLYLEIKCASLSEDTLKQIILEIQKFEEIYMSTCDTVAESVYDFINNPVIEDFTNINFTELSELFSDTEVFSKIQTLTIKKEHLDFVEKFSSIYYRVKYIYRMVYLISSDMVTFTDLPFKKDFIMRFRFAENTLVSQYAKLVYIEYTNANPMVHLILCNENINKMTEKILQDRNYDLEMDSHNVAIYTKSKYEFQKECLEIHSEIIDSAILLFDTFYKIYQVNNFINTFLYTEKVDETLWNDFTQFHRKMTSLIPFSKKKTIKIKKCLERYSLYQRVYKSMEKLEFILNE